VIVKVIYTLLYLIVIRTVFAFSFRYTMFPVIYLANMFTTKWFS